MKEADDDDGNHEPKETQTIHQEVTLKGHTDLTEQRKKRVQSTQDNN